jgi:hypothetical protein
MTNKCILHSTDYTSSETGNVQIDWKIGHRCNERDLRVCEEHWEMVEGKYVLCSICQKDGTVVQEHDQAPPFQAPWRVGENSFESAPKSLSRGNATDRATFHYVNKLCNNEHPPAHQQFIEMQDVHIGQQ